MNARPCPKVCLSDINGGSRCASDRLPTWVGQDAEQCFTLTRQRGRQRDRDVLGFRCARRFPTLPVGESSQVMNEPVKTLQQRLGGASFL